MSYKFITYEKRAQVALITINRPNVMNALHIFAHWELFQAFQEFNVDPNLRVAILTGAGSRAFSAGNDLKYANQVTVDHEPPKLLPLGGFGGLTNPRFKLWKPVIAAVNGYALGGGFELALACDLIIATDQAQFGLPEARVGLVPGAGGTHRLPRQLPMKVAMGMLLTGKRLSSDEAYRLGLVNEVVSLPDLLPTAERWAIEIIECAPLAIRGIKEATMTGLDLPLETAISNSYPWVEAHMNSTDRLEGIQAFVEKRPPEWGGGI
ncbi:enoyl-CoA hydratase-related protein [Dehalococcoidia bacterium]|nr:enoyl-CoA hydratase-related protein [Dehalococcoidia bacterium]